MKLHQSILAILVVLTYFSASQVVAEELVIPDDELARESVLPVFDVNNSVRNRNVVLTEKFELGLFGGWTTDEPIYNSTHFGGIIGYHFDETHGLNFMFGGYSSGVGSYSKQLNDQINLDLSKTFAPKSYLFANYQLMGYYGKLSLLKHHNINFHVFGTAGIGSINYDGEQDLALDFGIGQRIYFTPFLGVKLEYRFVRYNGPNPLSISDKNKLKSGALSISDYSSTTYFQNHITLGLVFLL